MRLLRTWALPFTVTFSMTVFSLGFSNALPEVTTRTESPEIKVEDFTPVSWQDASLATAPSSQATPSSSHDAQPSHAAHTHHFHHNHLALFLGVTNHGTHFYPTIGLDYEFLFNEKIGITAVVEQVFAEHSEQITGLGLAVHPFPSWKVAAIPALVVAEGHAAFLMRGTVEYGFHAGPFSYGPSVSVDYAHATVLVVLGLVLGMGF